MLTGDFVTMSRAADRARPSLYPNAWRIRNLTLAAIPLGLFKLAYCVAVLAAGWYVLRFTPDRMQTLTFVMLVFAGQANVFVLRERGRLWDSRPAPVMLLASAADVAVVGCLAASGVLMSPLPLPVIAILLLVTCVFALTMDSVKLATFAQFRID